MRRLSEDSFWLLSADNTSFPWLSSRMIDVAGFELLALRLGFTGELVGVVTSGAYGHHTETNIAMGYVDPAHAEPANELAIDVIGQRCGATVRAESMFDPEHRRPRADVDETGL